VGKGTTFHIFLPAAQKGTLPAVRLSSVTHNGSGQILVMDDEACIREILTRFLAEMGYTTLVAKNGEEAISICREAAKIGRKIAGAFLDLTIPGAIGGKEAVMHIRKDFPDLKIYASSGYSEDPVMGRPTEYGFTDSIRKPFRKDELANLLNKHGC
jgi:CheY-like chemotaxis protein